jgi:hypothetical protein
MEKSREMQGINGIIGAIVTGFCFLLFGASSALAAAPMIVKTGVSEVTSTSAMLEAEINPEGKAIRYHFEYGTADWALNSGTKNFEGETKVQTASLLPVVFVCVP